MRLLKNIREINISQGILIYTQYKNKVFHVLFAADLQGNNVRVITAYYPSLKEWKKDLKTRR